MSIMHRLGSYLDDRRDRIEMVRLRIVDKMATNELRVADSAYVEIRYPYFCVNGTVLICPPIVATTNTQTRIELLLADGRYEEFSSYALRLVENMNLFTLKRLESSVDHQIRKLERSTTHYHMRQQKLDQLKNHHKMLLREDTTNS